MSDSTGKSRIAIVSCVKTKRAVASAAADLYKSALFRGLRTYAERNADIWYILSAKHHLVRPDEVIEPYEKTLNRMQKRERHEWAERVKAQLTDAIPENAQVILLAGMRYREEIEPFLRERFTVTVPLEGLSFGRQLAWLKEHNERDRVG